IGRMSALVIKLSQFVNRTFTRATKREWTATPGISCRRLRPSSIQDHSSAQVRCQARLAVVPDMTAKDALTALKAHLAKRGFGDINVTMTGGYDATSPP